MRPASAASKGRFLRNPGSSNAVLGSLPVGNDIATAVDEILQRMIAAVHDIMQHFMGDNRFYIDEDTSQDDVMTGPPVAVVFASAIFKLMGVGDSVPSNAFVATGLA